MDQVQMIGGKQESELWHNTRMREQKLWQSTARAHLCSYSSKGNRNFITGFSGSLIRSLKAFEKSLLTSDDCSLRCQWKRMHLLSVQKMAPCGTFFFLLQMNIIALLLSLVWLKRSAALSMKYGVSLLQTRTNGTVG